MKLQKVKMTWHEWKMLPKEMRAKIQGCKRSTRYTLFSIEFKVPANRAAELGLGG
jgi:hypothetical protein